MKILICTGIYPPDIGGPATYSKFLKDGLPKLGTEVSVLSFGEVRHLPKIIRHIFYFFKILRVGKSSDIFYAQDTVSVGLPAFLASKILKKKFLLRIAGDHTWEQFQQKNKESGAGFITLDEFQNKKFDFTTELNRKIERWVSRRAHKIIVPSEYLKRIVLMWGVDKNRIRVIYNAFRKPHKVLSKDEARNKLNLSGTVLVSISRLVPWKGFSTLIKIMPEILKEIPDAKLYIGGSGPDKKKLELEIANSGLANNIFLKETLHQDVLEYMAGGDIFVLNTGYEGLSHLLLEALFVGIPVITTNVGGNPEVIENGKNGVLVEYDNKEELKNSIVGVYQGDILKNRSTGLDIEKFDKGNMIKSVLGVFKESL